MNAKDQKFDVREKPLTDKTPLSIQPSDSSSLGPNGDPISSGIDPVLLTMIALIFSSTIALLMGTMTWAYHRKSRQKDAYLRLIRPSPCQRCQYFYPHTPLKCAIHPSTVMTEASDDCRDYMPKCSK
jgi:hypothetical protein